MFNGNLNGLLDFTPWTSDTHLVSDILDLGIYGVKYEEGPMFANEDPHNNPDCSGTINPNWFDTTARRRLSKSKRRRLQTLPPINIIQWNPIREVRTPAPTFADGSSLPRQDAPPEPREIFVDICANGRSGCPQPADFEDCSDISRFPINAGTGDIDITLNELLNMRGINDCQRATREEQYEMARNFGYLKRLCGGCMDNFCELGTLIRRCAIGDTDDNGNPLQFISRSDGPLDVSPHNDNHNENNWTDWIPSKKIFVYMAIIIVVGLLINLAIMECTLIKKDDNKIALNYNQQDKV